MVVATGGRSVRRDPDRFSRSVLEGVDRRGDAAAELHEARRVAAGHADDRSFAEQAAEDGLFADALAGHGNDAHGGGLGVDHADGHFVGDHAGDRGRGRVAGDGDHVETDGADARHRLKLLHREGAAAGRGLDGAVLGDGDEGARKAAHMRGGEDAALLHGVVEHGQNGRRAGSADRGEAHRLEDLAHAVAHCRRRGKREIRHAERKVQAVGDFIADDFTHAGHFCLPSSLRSASRIPRRLALGRSAVFERSVSKLNDSRVSFLRGRFAGIGQ